MKKNEIREAWEITFRQWQRDENDQRDPMHEVPVDFAMDCIHNASISLTKVVKNTAQSLRAMLGDPTLQKDQKAQLRQIIEANEAELLKGKVVVNG